MKNCFVKWNCYKKINSFRSDKEKINRETLYYDRTSSNMNIGVTGLEGKHNATAIWHLLWESGHCSHRFVFFDTAANSLISHSLKLHISLSWHRRNTSCHLFRMKAFTPADHCELFIVKQLQHPTVSMTCWWFFFFVSRWVLNIAGRHDKRRNSNREVFRWGVSHGGRFLKFGHLLLSCEKHLWHVPITDSHHCCSWSAIPTENIPPNLYTGRVWCC